MIKDFKVRIFIILAGVAFLFLGYYFLPWQEAYEADKFLNPNTQTATSSHSNIAQNFPETNLEATSAVVFDINNEEIIYGKDPNKHLPLASITKLITLLTSADYLTPTTPIYIDASDLSLGSNAGLTAGHTWYYKDLADFMLTTSSNGAARAIRRATEERTGLNFVSLMNKKAQGLELWSFNFENETGLDEENRPGAIGSSLDVAKLMSYIISEKPDFIDSTRFPDIRKITTDSLIYSGRNTNLITEKIPGLIGSKTGFTEQAGGNLVVAFDAGLNHRFIAVVLGSSQEGRFSDINELIENTLISLSN